MTPLTEVNMSGHIFAPPVTGYKVTQVHCMTCDEKTEFLIQYWEWYSAEFTCLECGERYNAEEGRHERPFMRGWRERSIKEAREWIKSMESQDTLNELA